MKKAVVWLLLVLGMCMVFSGCGEEAVLKYQTLDNGEYMVVGVDNKEATSAVVPEEINGVYVTQIGLGAFANCEKLKKVELPVTIESIGVGAFQNCIALKEISLPAGLKEIAPAAFAYCASLEKAEFNEELKTIGMNAFLECVSLKEINLPESLEILDKKAFYGCSAAKKLTFSGEMEELGESIFENCTSLKEISFPKGLKEIGDSTFCGCASLRELILPEGLEKLSKQTFQNCKELSVLKIPASLEHFFADTFLGCYNLEEIKVSDNNRYYSSKDLDGNEINAIIRWIEDGGKKVGSLCVPDKGLTIPEGIDELYYTIYEDMDLKSLKVPSTISKRCLDDILESNPNLTTLYGVAGSKAEKWAEEHGIEFIAE